MELDPVVISPTVILDGEIKNFEDAIEVLKLSGFDHFETKDDLPEYKTHYFFNLRSIRNHANVVMFFESENDPHMSREDQARPFSFSMLDAEGRDELRRIIDDPYTYNLKAVPTFCFAFKQDMYTFLKMATEL